MLKKPQLFGTDGVRGAAGEYPLDSDTVFRLGLALGQVLIAEHEGKTVVLGEDTRESSAWISRTCAAGLRAGGCDVVYAGVITTPGIAFLTRKDKFAAGVMVSASHNPYFDNGIKVFAGNGTKLPEKLELEVEQILAGIPAGASIPDEPLIPSPGLVEEYLAYLEALAPERRALSQYNVVVDCANGAASRIAPELLRRLGIATTILSADPDGRNINVNCGSLHPEAMAQAVKSAGADFGVAFDGDADRAILATRNGTIIDGDHVLYAMAPFLRDIGQLKGNAVVGTLMTNLALELALAELGIGLKRTAVGDKYVLEEMLRSGTNLGGEPSGHLIFSDVSLAGDGLITLLEVLRLLAGTGKSLGELVRGLKQFPQRIVNVRVKEKLPLESIPEVAQAIRACRSEFQDRGRAVIRYSGTEPVARVMVESEEAEQVERHAAQIAGAIRSALGA
jgi:phosphoglucosamine mutase